MQSLLFWFCTILFFMSISLLLKQLIVNKCSGSVFIIGCHGSGKKQAFEHAFERYANDSNVLLISINAKHFTDDKQVLKFIGAEFARLTGLREDVILTNSISECIETLCAALDEKFGDSARLVCMFENINEFVERGSQNLLYTFLNYVQSTQFPLLVVGLSKNANIVELLEKRVRSRFSNRIISCCNDWTFDEFCTFAISLLSVPENLTAVKVANKWNLHIQNIFKEEKAVEFLQNIFEVSRSIQYLKRCLGYLICRLNPENPMLTIYDHFWNLGPLFDWDTRSMQVDSFSVLEIAMLISIINICKLRDENSFNFEMCYNQLQTFARKKYTLLCVSKDVAIKAFEKLIRSRMIYVSNVDVSLSLSAWFDNSLNHYQNMKLALSVDQLLTAVLHHDELLTSLKDWARNIAC